MFADTLAIIVLACAGFAVTYLLFNSVAAADEKKSVNGATAAAAPAAVPKASTYVKSGKAAAPKAVSPKAAAAAAPQKAAKAASPQQAAQQAQAQKKAAKAARAAAQAAEDELDAIVAKDLALANKGMVKDKAPLQTLDQIKAKQAAQAKKVAPVTKEAFSEEQKVSHKAHGFKSVQKQASPKAAQANKAAAEPKMSKKAALDKKLGQFFKGGGGDKKKRPQEEEVAGNGGTVSMKQAFKTTDPRGLWTGEHEW